MHEAYEVSYLLNNTVQIEAIAAYDDNLLLGTRQGYLLMYSLSDGNGNQKYEVKLLRYCKNFSKKPIQQIEVIPEDNLLLCLTDNVLGIYDINGDSFPLIKTLAQTKGASLFALDNKSTTSMTGESNSVVRLCVAVRRKLQLYYGKNGEFKQHLFDFTIPDVPKLISWGQEYLCVAFKSEYVLYDLSSGKPLELFPTGSSRPLEPTIAKYSDTCYILGKDSTSVLVEEQKTEIKKVIKWNSPPLAIVWDEPYILGLLQEDVVVQTVEPAMFVQTLPDLVKARLMYRCRSGLIFLCSMGQVWCLSAVDITKQRQHLLKEKQFQIAIDLTKISNCSEEEKKQKIHSIQMLYALDLFDKKQYSQSMKEFMKLNTDPAEVIKLFPQLNDPKENELKGKELENAINALIQYLREVRLKIGSGITAVANTPNINEHANINNKQIASQLELIDTTLLKCYLQTNDAFVAPLLRLNHCRFDEAEKTLLQHGKHSELIILYQTKGQHQKALQLLREQAKQPDSSLKGFHRTKTYLQFLGSEHINLIFQFSDWVLKEHPEEGLKIFTEDIPEIELLPRPKVLDYLLREHDPLVIPYLEHVIHAWNEKNSIFHNALIRMYREKMTDKKLKLTVEEIEHTKVKLLAFLEKSSCYTPETVLLHFPNDSLFEERAIVLGKLERHEQALSIYVLILGDVESAIRYCDTISKTNKEKSQDVYGILMGILINPENDTALSGPLARVPRNPNSTTPDLEAALRILEQYGEKISPMKALSVLPDNVPLSRLKNFFQVALDEKLRMKRKTQVLKGLLYAEHLQIQEMKKFHESKFVVINDYNICPVCKKRFSNQSAFIRYPTGEIVHYSCRSGN